MSTFTFTSRNSNYVTITKSGTAVATSIIDTVPDYTYEPDYDINAPGAGTAYPNQGDFPALANTTTPNPYHWWEMTVTSQDSLGADVVVTQGLLNFTDLGRLNTTPDANGVSTLTLAAANLPFSSTAGIEVDVTSITQFSGAYETNILEQNGAGERKSISIDNEGTVFAQFTNALSLPIYRIPLAMFNNPNGLERVDGTAFRIPSDGESGDLRIEDARSGGAGTINASTLESSNVDIANEFGDLIVTQRAYSLNSQVIQAVNEMTQNLSQLKG
jgi:flagellar hook protein FlgE